MWDTAAHALGGLEGTPRPFKIDQQKPYVFVCLPPAFVYVQVCGPDGGAVVVVGRGAAALRPAAHVDAARTPTQPVEATLQVSFLFRRISLLFKPHPSFHASRVYQGPS